MCSRMGDAGAWLVRCPAATSGGCCTYGPTMAGSLMILSETCLAAGPVGVVVSVLQTAADRRIEQVGFGQDLTVVSFAALTLRTVGHCAKIRNAPVAPPQ